jgi:glycosyltransferase involved in cell wall biosynthesis
VLQVVPYYEEAWAYGGIPRAAAALARNLVARGHDVTVCTTDACDGRSRLGRNPGARPDVVWEPCGGSRPATGSPGRAEREGVWGPFRGPHVNVVVFPNVSNRLAYDLQFFLPRGLGRYLRRHAREFDVAHLHGCHHVPGAIAAHHLRRAAVPYVLTPHGTAPRIERRRVAKWIFDVTLGRGVTERAARLIAVTEAERRQLLRLGISAAAIRVVPNAVDLTEFEVPVERGRFRDRFGLSPGPLVMFLGKLTPRKHVDVLVDAFASLRRLDATLVIAGNDLGAGNEVRRHVRAAGLEQRTRFTGLLVGRQRLEALADADVLVYAGSDEVFGLVPLEAILCGTPAIVGDDSGCAEIIGEVGGGATVPPRDAHHLAAAIANALEDPDGWRRAAHEATPRVRARFSGERAAALIEDVYREVLAPPVAAPHGARSYDD